MTAHTGSGAAIPLEVLRLGLVGYQEALDFQQARQESVIQGRAPDTLLILEHEPAVTMGRGGEASHLHMPEEELARRGCPVFWTDRGGMATFHGPGQLVCYPIIRLQEKDLHAYMAKLLGVCASVLARFGLKAELSLHGPGVWVNGGKIASVGMAVRRWTTLHGIALNVNTNLEWFDFITPCGRPSERIASMERELGCRMDMDLVASGFVEEFCRAFGFAVPEDPLHPRPWWLSVSLPQEGRILPVENLLADLRLHTVCQEAECPNHGACYASGTATFLIMGDVCTRGCRYCAVGKGRPAPLDPEEPARLAQAVKRMRLSHAVVTSVTRDDLPDGGALHFAQTIRAIRSACPGCAVEVLVPDFAGDACALDRVLLERPEVFNHNIETVRRLFPQVRPKASYDASLRVLRQAARQGLLVKSGIMLGLGETWEETRETLQDLYDHGARLVTLGQYLAPSGSHWPVARYVAPDEFEHWRGVALAMGFAAADSAPLVRSSYRAGEMLGRTACQGGREAPAKL